MNVVDTPFQSVYEKECPIHNKYLDVYQSA